MNDSQIQRTFAPQYHVSSVTLKAFFGTLRDHYYFNPLSASVALI